MMHFPPVLCLILFSYLNMASIRTMNISAKYLQDTIKDLKLKTNNRNSATTSTNLPSLNTLNLRRVYNPQAGPTLNFGQSHDALSQEVDKLVDNVAAMISEASEEEPQAPHPQTRPRPSPPQAPPTRQPPPAQGQTAQVPSLHLTKAELAALYVDAVQKGDTIKLDGDAQHTGEPLTAAVHEMGVGGASGATRGKPNLNAAKRPDNGYYYYYYPLNSFMDEMASAPSSLTTHNVNIQPQHSDTNKKGLEPLFMAISGFIGMSVMFVLSVLVLPKFKRLKPKGLRREGLDPDGEEFYSFGRVALEAIDGYDCTERFQCEAGKTAHAFGLYNNRFVKLLRRIGPFAIVQQINKAGKFTNKKYRCATIPCKQGGVVNKPQPKPTPPIKL